MIVRSLPGDRLLLIDQVDHARLSGEMAAAHSAGGAPDRPAVEAARHHDDGWEAWDRRPRLNPETGAPHSYRDVPPGDHLEIWERTVAAGWERGDAVGLLVSLHGCRFFARKERPVDRAFLRRERAWQGRVLGLDPDGVPDRLPPEVARDHGRMAFWDGLSLFLCDRWESPWTAEVPWGDGQRRVEVRRTGGGDAGDVTLSPHPFGSPLELQVEARRITGVPFGSQAALDRAVSGAEPVKLRWRLAPG